MYPRALVIGIITGYADYVSMHPVTGYYFNIAVTIVRSKATITMILLNIKPTRINVEISQNIEGKFELKKKILCACRLSKGRVSRIDLGIKSEL